MKRQNLRTVSLIVVTLTYLLIGAAIFGYLESEHEVRQRETLELIELIVKRKYNISDDDFTVLTTTVIKSVPHKAGTQWKFPGAFYFATTVVTTIGYGHSTPATLAGRCFCMIYALIGIPLGLVMFQSIGERLNTFVGSALKYAKRCFRAKNPEVTQTNLVMVVSVLSTILMTSMAAVFAKYERWEYFDALYYCFITLTTIGFGDYVALQKDSALQSKPEYVALSLIFILFGLSVVSSAVNLLVLKFLTLNTEDERRDEHLRHVASLEPVPEGDVIVTSRRPQASYSDANFEKLSKFPANKRSNDPSMTIDRKHLVAVTQPAASVVPRRLKKSQLSGTDSEGFPAHLSVAKIGTPSMTRSLSNHNLCCAYHRGFLDCGSEFEEVDGDEEDYGSYENPNKKSFSVPAETARISTRGPKMKQYVCPEHCYYQKSLAYHGFQEACPSQHTKIDAEPSKQTSSKGLHQHQPFITSPDTHHSHLHDSHGEKQRANQRHHHYLFSPMVTSPHGILLATTSPVIYHQRLQNNLARPRRNNAQEILSIEAQMSQMGHSRTQQTVNGDQPLSQASSCSCSCPSLNNSEDICEPMSILPCSQCHFDRMVPPNSLFARSMSHEQKQERRHHHHHQEHYHDRNHHHQHHHHQRAHLRSRHQDESINELASSRTLSGYKIESSNSHSESNQVARTSSARILNLTRSQTFRSSSSTSLATSKQEPKSAIKLICKNCCQHLECIEHAFRARVNSTSAGCKTDRLEPKVLSELENLKIHVDDERKMKNHGDVTEKSTFVKDEPIRDNFTRQDGAEPSQSSAINTLTEILPARRAKINEAEQFFEGDTKL